MIKYFEGPILELPEADIPLKGIKAYLSQGDNHQIIFMEFSEDVLLPEHTHESQWGTILNGKLDFTIGAETKTYQKGENYFIPAGVPHSGQIYGGLVVIEYFNQRDRYPVKGK